MNPDDTPIDDSKQPPFDLPIQHTEGVPESAPSLSLELTHEQANELLASRLAALGPETTPPATLTDAERAAVLDTSGFAEPEVVDESQQILTRLDQAHALEELHHGAGIYKLASRALAAFSSFRHPDGRTMNVVVVDGKLFSHDANASDQPTT